MFRLQKEKRLDLGKQYKFQVDTGMLIQNNAFGNLSKNTESFVNSYVKKQEKLRKSQKIALDVYGKRGVIDDADAAAAKALALSLAGVANTAIQLTRATTEMDKSFARLTLRAKEQAAVKEVGREVRLKRTGLLAGMPEVKAPQIDIRRFSELGAHEKLRVASPEYEKTLLAHDKQLDVYNAAVAKAEASAKTLADIEYVEEEAATRGIDQKKIDALVASVAITGSKETGPMLGELSTQTELQHEMVNKLSTLVDFSSGGMGTGIKFATMTKEASGVYDTAELRQQTIRAVHSDVAGYMAKGDYGGVYAYGENLEKASTSAPFTKQTMVSSILGSGAVSSGALEAILTSKEVGVTPESYAEAKEKGKIDVLLGENYERIMDLFLQYGKDRAEGKEKETIKEPGVGIDFLGLLQEKAVGVVEERKEYAEKTHEANLEDAKVQGNIAAVFAQSLSKSQKAMRMFTLVAGDLAKSVETLSESFLKLEKQSMINKALIDTRAKYRSTRGGPMERRAPAVDVDIATTAQYSPHQVLYEQSAQYKSVTIGYLKNMEDVKTARSKLEELSKIEAQKEFLGKQPGVKKEDVDSFISAAMRTGSVEIAPIVVELAKLNKTASSIDAKTVELKDGKSVIDKQKSGEDMLSVMQQQAEADNRKAEMLAKRSADYMRKAQIRKQTDIDVATGSGMSQDQVNKEESRFMATIGYVPSEIKERNQRLRAEYEKEKKARAEFELNKQRMLKPLQQAAGGMGSIISSIQTGVAGIEGGRNVRPLEIDFTQWSQGRSEEDIAEARGQFDLAKSIYSQNLSLRAQGADTGVAPRKLYDIMERASKGEDVTDELKAIEATLAEKKEEKEEQIRKLQAQEYAKAVSNSEGTKKTNTELSAINENTRSMAGALNEGFSKVTSALEATSKTVSTPETAPKIEAAKAYTEPYSDVVKNLAEEHQFGVPVGQDTARTTIPGLVGREDYLLAGAGRTLPEATDLSFEEKTKPFVGTGFGFAEAVIPTAEEPGQLAFVEKVKDYLPGVLGQADNLLASDEQRKKSQMAVSLFGESFVEKPDLGYGALLEEAGKTEEEIKKEEMIKSAAKGGLIMTLPKEGESPEEFSERTKSSEQRREEARRKEIADSYRADRPVDSYEVLKEEAGELDIHRGAKAESDAKRKYQREHAFEGTGLTVDSVSMDEKEKAAGLKKEDEKSKNLKKETLNKDTKQGDESRKESKTLNNEISDLKDEVEKLKTAVSDTTEVFKDLSDVADNVTALGDASKDSAALVDTLGTSADSASSSLDILASKTSTSTVTEETGPTMVAEAEDFDFISEEDALNLVNFVKEDLDERIRNIDNTEVIAGLVEKTETLTSDVASMKEGVTSTEDTVSEKAFDDFKFIVAGYVKTIEELKKLTDALTDTSLSHSTSILDLETAFGLVEDKLRDHDEQLTKFEENLGSMDHKFTNLISDLEDDVATAIDLARAAYTFATV
jgi:hypothetical protein